MPLPRLLFASLSIAALSALPSAWAEPLKATYTFGGLFIRWDSRLPYPVPSADGDIPYTGTLSFVIPEAGAGVSDGSTTSWQTPGSVSLQPSGYDDPIVFSDDFLISLSADTQTDYQPYGAIRATSGQTSLQLLLFGWNEFAPWVSNNPDDWLLDLGGRSLELTLRSGNALAYTVDFDGIFAGPTLSGGTAVPDSTWSLGLLTSALGLFAAIGVLRARGAA